ncbi:MAG: hypothetical protein K2J87_07800, partial [Muribaculaceae bacterium]|nr:hypothetical protein [Muribaculaceae bacterium]
PHTAKIPPILISLDKMGGARCLKTVQEILENRNGNPTPFVQKYEIFYVADERKFPQSNRGDSLSV